MPPDRQFIVSAVVAVATWTLFCLIAWALVGVGGALIEAIIEIVLFALPGVADALQAVVRFLSSLGGGVIAAIWALGAVTIAFGTYILRHGDGMGFVYRESVYYGPGQSTRSDWSPGGRPMKDVTPPRDENTAPPSNQQYLPRR